MRLELEVEFLKSQVNKFFIYLWNNLALIVFNLFQIDYSNPFEGNSTIAIIGVVAGICAILLLVLLRFSKMIEEKTRQ